LKSVPHDFQDWITGRADVFKFNPAVETSKLKAQEKLQKTK